MNTIKKLLMLDLDGTVRRPIQDPEGFIKDPLDQEIIPCARAAIARYAADGWTIVGITNQAGVHYKRKSLKDCIKEQKHTMKLVPELDRIYFCPDLGDQLCVVHYALFGCKQVEIRFGGMGDNPRNQLGGYRKPDPGMLRAATWDYMEKTIEGLEQKLFVGDMLTDKQAANAALCPFLSAEKWWVNA